MCGIIGIIAKSPIPQLMYNGMLQLQHRGQDATGIFSYDPVIDRYSILRKMGLVSTFFASDLPLLPNALWGIGHLRYTTSGMGQISDAQPLLFKKDSKAIVLAHNGNLVNYSSLSKAFQKKGIFFQTTCDTEALLHIIAQKLTLEGSFFDELCSAVNEIYSLVEGSYSIIGTVTKKGMFAFRDPNGIRPLLLGKGKDLFAIASETLALKQIGCVEIEDIPPGEIIFIDDQNQLHRKMIYQKKHAHCSFEFNYFAKAHTIMERKEIYTIRAELGRLLGVKMEKEKLPSIDAIVPIPDTGIPAAIALAHYLRIPLAEGFVRQSQIGRTFILPGQEKRQGAVVQKLAPISSVFKDKVVVLVDDSIVRGTVSKRTIQLAKDAGAKQIIFASTFPPIRFPCIYGIDFPCLDQLIAHDKTTEEISSMIGADFVFYNDVENLKEAIDLQDLCLACLTGEYPTKTTDMETLQKLRKKELLTTL